MTPENFLATVLPSQGLYCICELTTPRLQHEYVQSVEDVGAWAEAFDGRELATYYAMASFAKAGSRAAANARLLRSLYIDIDIDPEGKGGKYTSKREAVEALKRFLADTTLDTLGTPWVIDSGGGVHVYWPLTEDLPVAEWLPLAQALKALARAHSFMIDYGVTADYCRVLRVPGTRNFKYDPPRPVTIKLAGSVFDAAALRDKLPLPTQVAVARPMALAIPGKAPTALQAPSAVAKALAQDGVTKFRKIMMRTAEGTGCGQLAYYADHAQEDGMEPLWRGLLSIANKCEDGWQAAQKLSAMHPYDSDRLQRKWSEIRGPYPCTKLDSENPGICPSCPHWGKITNPLALGREYTQVETVEHVVDEETGETEAVSLPPPPRNYAFMQNSVRRVVTDADGTDYVPVIPFILYLHSVLQEDSAYIARFCQIIDRNRTKMIALPMKSVASKEETIRLLAQQNIFAAYGPGNDKHLFEYVRGCVAEACIDDRALYVPPKYGWQPTGGFAYGDSVVAKDGTYTFASDKLSNLIESMRPRGNLQGWQRIIDMLVTKEYFEVLTLGMIGLASPLMRWNNNGADAMVFHAGSRESGVGKSLALGLARSVWGNARFSVVPNTSETTMLQRAGFLGGLPLLVDEVTNKNRNSDMEWIPNFIFNYSQANHKTKGSGAANAELSNNLTWNALALITSNSPVLEHMLGARTTSSNGEVQRFLEWRSERQLSFNDSERDVLQLLNENYGHAGPAFAAWLVNNEDEAQRVFQKCLRRWRETINARDSERYWVAGGAAILAATILAGPKYANICSVPSARVALVLKQWVEEARALIADTVSCAEDLYSAFLREHNGSFVKVGFSNAMAAGLAASAGASMAVTTPDSARGRVLGRVEINTQPGLTRTLLDLSAIKLFCSLRNWSFLQFKREMLKNAQVREVTADIFSGTNLPSVRSRYLEIIQPTAAAHAAKAEA
jgi:hypothetical protein